MMEAYRAPFPDYWSRAGTLAFQRDPAHRARPQRQADGLIHERLATLDVPVLLVWGMRDPVFQPVFLEQWRELFPDAQTVQLDDAAYYLVEDSPGEVTSAIERFLR